MITRLYVDNFRCLVNFECKLDAEQLILGPNGAGKSTLFDVLMTLRDFCALGQPGDDRFADLTRTRWQDVAEQRFELDVYATAKYNAKLVDEEAALDDSRAAWKQIEWDREAVNAEHPRLEDLDGDDYDVMLLEEAQ